MSSFKRMFFVFKSAWQQRNKLAGIPVGKEERAFLPAALELTETPVSPLPRTLMLLLCLMILTFTLWSVFGRIDIVAVTTGKIIPSGNVKILQPLDNAVIKGIFVENGQRVRKGQLLIELDADTASAEKAKVEAALGAFRLQEERSRLLLDAVDRRASTIGEIRPIAGIHARELDYQTRLLKSQFDELTAKLGSMQAEEVRLKAGRETTRETLNKLLAMQPLLDERAADYRQLSTQNYISRHQVMDREQLLIENRKEIDIQRSRLAEVDTVIAKQEQQKRAFLTEFIRTNHEKLADAQQRIIELTQDQIKIGSRLATLNLQAPVDGIVQQLAIHTVGGVVTAAQPLLVIVPDREALVIEAFVENKDIGFVRAGQSVEIKVAAFPFTRYGFLHGKLMTVSDDAIEDEKMGLVYQAKVQMNENAMNIDGKRVRLSPGMAVQAEIKTGKRHIIEYFLSPILQYQQESLRER